MLRVVFSTSFCFFWWLVRTRVLTFGVFFHSTQFFV